MDARLSRRVQQTIGRYFFFHGNDRPSAYLRATPPGDPTRWILLVVVIGGEVDEDKRRPWHPSVGGGGSHAAGAGVGADVGHTKCARGGL